MSATRLPEDLFHHLFGGRRGVGREDATALPELLFRIVRYRSRERVYDPTDALVQWCEQCSLCGWLRRDWDGLALPALCLACSVARNLPQPLECESWCHPRSGLIGDVHTGLCRP